MQRERTAGRGGGVERAVKVAVPDGTSLEGRALWQRDAAAGVPAGAAAGGVRGARKGQPTGHGGGSGGSGNEACSPCAETEGRSAARSTSGTGGTGSRLRPAEIALVIMHPYGPLGGDMDNNVVQAVYEAAVAAGYAAICFNFRGVGRSTGRTSWRGTGEIEDVRAICKFILGPPPPDQGAVQVKAVVLVVGSAVVRPGRVTVADPTVSSGLGGRANPPQGYSFGAAVAASAIDSQPEVVGYAGIAFPFTVLWALTLFNGGTIRDAIQRSAKPKLFVQGDSDTFTSKASFTAALADVAPTAAVRWLQGADHFLFGREDELVPIVLGWVRSIVATEATASTL